MELFSPATRENAVALVRSQSPTFDLPSHRRLFGRQSLDALFDRGHRRPEVIWAVRDDAASTGTVLGLLGARAVPATSGDWDTFGLVDLFALPDPTHPAASTTVDMLLTAMTAWARTCEHVEASFGVPVADRPLDQPGTARVVDSLAAHGWRVLVTRRHYHFGPTPDLGADIPLTARIERAAPNDRPRLETLLRQVLSGSLDEHDITSIRTYGLAGAASRLATELIEADPIDCLRFAVVDGQDAGFAIWRVVRDNGFLTHVGVAEAFRGRGLSRELVGAATRDLVAAGARTLIADTDDTNWPMSDTFAAVGWRQTESRIDLTLA